MCKMKYSSETLFFDWSPLNFRQETLSGLNTEVQNKSWVNWVHFRRDWKPVDMTQEETGDEYIRICLKMLYCVWVKVLVGLGAEGVAPARSFCPLLRHLHRSVPVEGSIGVACREISGAQETPGKLQLNLQEPPGAGSSWVGSWQNVFGSPPTTMEENPGSMQRDPRAEGGTRRSVQSLPTEIILWFSDIKTSVSWWGLWRKNCWWSQCNCEFSKWG